MHLLYLLTCSGSPLLTCLSRSFSDQAITGDVLSLLSSDDLRDLGIPSLGHRLGILKMVHQLKVTQGLPIEEGSWVPSGEKLLAFFPFLLPLLSHPLFLAFVPSLNSCGGLRSRE